MTSSSTRDLLATRTRIEVVGDRRERPGVVAEALVLPSKRKDAGRLTAIDKQQGVHVVVAGT